MTREEAIKFLTLMRKAVSNFEEYGHDKAIMIIECDKAEAIDMAIEALSAEETPTLSEKHQLSHETPTNTISRADAIDAVHGACAYCDTCDLKDIGCSQINALSALPSAEAVPRDYYEKVVGQLSHEVTELKAQVEQIVQCKDCDRGFGSPVCPIQSQGWAINTDTFYCAWGERREL